MTDHLSRLESTQSSIPVMNESCLEQKLANAFRTFCSTHATAWGESKRAVSNTECDCLRWVQAVVYLLTFQGYFRARQINQLTGNISGSLAYLQGYLDRHDNERGWKTLQQRALAVLRGRAQQVPPLSSWERCKEFCQQIFFKCYGSALQEEHAAPPIQAVPDMTHQVIEQRYPEVLLFLKILDDMARLAYIFQARQSSEREVFVYMCGYLDADCASAQSDKKKSSHVHRYVLSFIEEVYKNVQSQFKKDQPRHEARLRKQVAKQAEHFAKLFNDEVLMDVFPKKITGKELPDKNGYLAYFSSRWLPDKIHAAGRKLAEENYHARSLQRSSEEVIRQIYAHMGVGLSQRHRDLHLIREMLVQEVLQSTTLRAMQKKCDKYFSPDEIEKFLGEESRDLVKVLQEQQRCFRRNREWDSGCSWSQMLSYSKTLPKDYEGCADSIGERFMKEEGESLRALLIGMRTVEFCLGIATYDATDEQLFNSELLKWDDLSKGVERVTATQSSCKLPSSEIIRDMILGKIYQRHFVEGFVFFDGGEARQVVENIVEKKALISRGEWVDGMFCYANPILAREFLCALFKKYGTERVLQWFGLPSYNRWCIQPLLPSELEKVAPKRRMVFPSPDGVGNERGREKLQHGARGGVPTGGNAAHLQDEEDSSAALEKLFQEPSVEGEAPVYEDGVPVYEWAPSPFRIMMGFIREDNPHLFNVQEGDRALPT